MVLTISELFKEIRLNNKWIPKNSTDYSNIKIDDLKNMADNYFDELNYQGRFFHDYHNVLSRIELLRVFKNKTRL